MCKRPLRFQSAPSSGLTRAIFEPSLIQGATKLRQMLGWTQVAKKHVGPMAGDNEADVDLNSIVAAARQRPLGHQGGRSPVYDLM